MPRSIVTRVYEYDELSPEAQEAAREEMGRQEDEFLSQDGSQVRETIEEYLDYAWGLPGLRVYYSLNNCQGDGVAFEGAVGLGALFDFKETPQGEKDQKNHGWEARKRLKELHDKLDRFGQSVDVHVRHRDNHYYHAYTMDVEVVLHDEVHNDNRYGRYEDLTGPHFTDEVREHDAAFFRAIEAGVEVGDWLPVNIACDHWDETDALPAEVTAELRALMTVEADNAAGLKAFEEEFLEFVQDASHGAEKQGYDEIEYVTTDPERLTDLCRDYSPGFRKSGKMVNCGDYDDEEEDDENDGD